MTYEQALYSWKDMNDINDWIRGNFRYDSSRAMSMASNRSQGRPAVYTPQETFLKQEGVCIENTVYVCAADQTGIIFAGRSMVIDPMGIIVASAGEEEAVFAADIDLDRIKRVRDKLPCLGHRRPELYMVR